VTPRIAAFFGDRVPQRTRVMFALSLRSLSVSRRRLDCCSKPDFWKSLKR